MPTRKVTELLEEHDTWLVGVVRRRSGWLARVESLEDLLQDVRLRAIRAGATFEDRGDDSFKAWLRQLIDGHFADRHRYWAAARRAAGPLVRVTEVGAPSSLRGGVEPSATGPGPVTWADRRDQHAIAMRAIRSLLPRDQQLVEWTSQDLSAREMAERLGATEVAASRAKLRAIERFKRAYEVHARAHGG